VSINGQDEILFNAHKTFVEVVIAMFELFIHVLDNSAIRNRVCHFKCKCFVVKYILRGAAHQYILYSNFCPWPKLKVMV